ncbi:unnamed protein product [Kuraishia capsulata CBS 1993]|uniref:Glu-AdT subunit F n=1 Tax=Kuraishia capsulata CBS 1993 TaxID=1382522 RepID=W6MRH0_9ASCO|nr:uncharacterized protein KUCA_T00003821001 [Kuraishia capsulata CBS 1993]CDK27842.1 unnamed protein product [Kuraishia capsulata CBS 1993]
MFLRSIRRLSGIGKPFKTIQEVEEYLARPNWATAELLVKAGDDGLSREKLLNLQQLSGLNAESNEETEATLLKSIQRQLGFIRNIEDLALPVEGSTVDTRLIPKPKALVFADLVKHAKSDPEKGEVFDSWNPTGLAVDSDDGYYVVRDSLDKNEEKAV